MRILILLAVLLLAPLGALAQTDQPTGTITAEGSAQSDAVIAQRLRDIMAELGGYEDVTVTVSSGIVTYRGTTLDPADTARLTAIAGRVEGVVAIENDVTETGDVVRRLDPVRDRLLDRIDQGIALLPLILIALIVFLIVLILGLLLARRPMFSRLAPNAFIADIYRMVVRLVFGVLGLVLALDILNATALLSTILGAAGIIGLAVGFAVRDTVENFIASIMLSIRQPFRPNDAVEINGDEGLVIRLTSRATILLSFDGNHIRIPNATVFKSRIVNYTRNPERRFLFEIGVASDADLATVRQLAQEVISDLPFALVDPAPLTWIDRIGDGAIFLTVTGWIDQRETNLLLAKGEALRKVKAAVEAAGVEVPDTTYRITFGNSLPGSGTALVAEDNGRVPDAGGAKTPDLAKAQAAIEVNDTTQDATAQSLDKIVADERADADKPDLLRENAPEE